MDAAELETFDDAVAGLLDDSWGTATNAATANVEKLWAAAANAGWLELAEFEALDALMRAVRGTGRAACPLPLADVYAASLLLVEHPELIARIRSAEIRPLVVAEPQALHRLEAASAATHVLVMPSTGPSQLLPITHCRPLAGVGVPQWSAVEVGEPLFELEVTDRDRRQTIAILRLALAGRAVAAAEKAHELALEHACVRKQFGKPIGSFGAVQQRAAAAHIEVSAAKLLIDEAVHRFGYEDWPLAVELAVEHARTATSPVQFGAQHTLGAIGFFEEHEAPWLFRRVHADLARLHDHPADTPADLLLASERSLPALDIDDQAARFRGELRSFLQQAGLIRREPQPFVDDPDVVATLASAGYFGLTWSSEYGGRGLRAAEQAVLMEEIGYGRVASYVALNAVMFLGDAITRFGSSAQREQFLPLIREGKLRFCLGYSEPDTGSDLAALITRAHRDGDDWVVNGQKTWTTRAHESDWIWLALRTDPDHSRRHAGITVFLLPLATPGIKIDQHRSQAGEISCSVFFDGVRVPDSARIGEVNGGWAVINTALAGERVAMGAITGTLHALLDDLLVKLRREPELVGPAGSAKRAIVANLAARLQGARALVRAAVAATTAGGGSRLEAPMAGVMGGELAEQFGQQVVEVLGAGALSSSVAENDVFVHNLLLSVKYVVGGGTNDVLRGLIARSLGLPK